MLPSVRQKSKCTIVSVAPAGRGGRPSSSLDTNRPVKMSHYVNRGRCFISFSAQNCKPRLQQRGQSGSSSLRPSYLSRALLASVIFAVVSEVRWHNPATHAGGGSVRYTTAVCLKKKKNVEWALSRESCTRRHYIFVFQSSNLLCLCLLLLFGAVDNTWICSVEPFVSYHMIHLHQIWNLCISYEMICDSSRRLSMVFKSWISPHFGKI